MNHDLENFQKEMNSTLENVPTCQETRWKLIQMNTFTRWINEHLKTFNMKVDSLKTDFCDGIRLAALLSALSQKNSLIINKRPNFRTQMLENVTQCMKFIEEVEHIKIVNIDSSDIVDGNIKLIMGLVWTLILHYAISMPVWEDCVNDAKERVTPKKRLLNWIVNKIPGKRISNFTTDWNDGTALGALVDSCYPGLCPDWEKWITVDALQNTTDAMDLAENWLDVPKLIKPEEITDPNVDEQSVMTYLSNYPHMSRVPNAPVRPKCCPVRVIVHGKGLMDIGNVTNTETQFIVDTSEAGDGVLVVEIINDVNELIECNVVQDYNNRYIYRVSYVPHDKGSVNVSVLYSETHIPHSPFKVFIQDESVKLSCISVDGSLFNTDDVYVNHCQHVDIEAPVDVFENIRIMIVDNNGDDANIEITSENMSQTKLRYNFNFTNSGSFTVLSYYKNKPLEYTPIKVTVLPAISNDNIIAYGRGIAQSGIRVGENVSFTVYCPNELKESESLTVNITSPNGVINPKINKSTLKTGTEFSYVPNLAGAYSIEIKCCGKLLNMCPINIRVMEDKDTGIKVYGVGIECGQVNRNCTFSVETNNEADNLSFDIKGPSRAKISAREVDDKTVDFTYVPSEPGHYELHLSNNGEDIPGSPWIVYIKPEFKMMDPENVDFVYDKSLQLSADKEEKFIIDLSNTVYKDINEKDLTVRIIDDNYNVEKVSLIQDSCYLYSFNYLPSKQGKIRVLIDVNGCAIKKSPYRFSVVCPMEPQIIQVYGPAVESKVINMSCAYFYIRFCKPTNDDVKVSCRNQEGTLVDYSLEKDGNVHIVNLNFVHVGLYDLDIDVVDSQSWKITVENNFSIIPSSEPFLIFCNENFTHTVNLSGLDFIDFVENYTGYISFKEKKYPALVTMKDKLLSISFNCPFVGNCYVYIMYNNQLMKDFPKTISVSKRCDPSKVKIYGEGLNENINVGECNVFYMDLSEAGVGNIDISVEGQEEVEVVWKEEESLTRVDYTIRKSGWYKFKITFDGENIPNGEFSIVAKDCLDITKIIVNAPESPVVVGKLSEFFISTMDAGEADLDVTLYGDDGIMIPCRVVEGKDHFQQRVKFTALKPGKLRVKVKYGDIQVFDEPVVFTVSTDVSQININGDIFNENVDLWATVPISFSIDMNNVIKGNLVVNIMDDNKVHLPVELKYEETCKLTNVEFCPKREGNVYISILYDNVLIRTVKKKVKCTGKADKVYLKFKQSELIPVCSENYLTVNTTTAGDGQLNADVINEGEYIPVNIVQDDGIYKLSYVPMSLGLCQLKLHYGGNLVPSQITQQAVTQVEYDNYLSKYMFNFEQYDNDNHKFVLPYSGSINNVEIFIKEDKCNNQQICFFYDNGNSTLTVSSSTTVPNSYSLILKSKNIDVDLKYHIYKKEEKNIAYGGGLSHGFVNDCLYFYVELSSNSMCKNVPIDVEIEGPAKVSSSCVNETPNLYKFKYTPLKPGKYTIFVKIDNMAVKNSPFQTLIFSYPETHSLIKVNTTFVLSNSDMSQCILKSKDPNGHVKNLPYTCKNDKIIANIDSNVVGAHVVCFYSRKAEKMLNFSVVTLLTETEPIELEKIKVCGLNTKEINMVHVGPTPYRFIVDASDTGGAPLGVSIDGPSQCKITSKKLLDNKYEIFYNIQDPGNFEVNITYNGELLPQCPFLVDAIHKPKDREEAHAYKISNADSKAMSWCSDINNLSDSCRLMVNFNERLPDDAIAVVKCPSGCLEPCDIRRIETGHNCVIFYPKEIGEHYISLKLENKHIEGSPFSYMVHLKDVNMGWNTVRVKGKGLAQAYLDETASFKIYTLRHGGNGNININIEGPSRTFLNFDEESENCMIVTYKCTKKGKYAIRINYDNHEIIGSPFRVNVVDSCDSSMKDNMLHIDLQPIPTTFTLTSNTAKNLKCYVMSPTEKTISAKINKDGENKCCVVFLPFENGTHKLYIQDTITGKELKDCPYLIEINNVNNGSDIRAVGDGTVSGVVGKRNRFKLITQNAGQGKLSVEITGPSKVVIETSDCEDGCDITYTCNAPGTYKIEILYNDEAIHKSPFIVKISDDASNYSSNIVTGNEKVKNGSVKETVHVSGAALKTAQIGKTMEITVESKFPIDNEFMVGMKGPSNPFDKVHIDKVSDSKYLVSYIVSEKGNYLLSLLWGGNHVEGSPFTVKAF